MNSSNARIVLVAPQGNLNIGAVARAMMNLGFEHLHMIAPPEWDFDEAKITACSAIGILEKVQIHDSLEAALAEMEEVVGFSARVGKNRSGHLLLPDWIEKEGARGGGRLALVFGPEDRGLSAEEAEHCRYLVEIPANPAYSSFNLAQAVLIVLYELSRGKFSGQVKEPVQEEGPTWNEFYQLDRLIEETGTKSGFFRDGTPAVMPGIIKNLFRRLEPKKREMSILLALFARLNTALQMASGVRTPENSTKP